MDQEQKKLYEDIDRIVNIKPNTKALKQQAEKVFGEVKQKFEELLKNGKYNLVISSLKRLTEENENNKIK